MSSSFSLPLPFLPTEVKKEILKFCDQPTLAKTSSLSLAFLELSSPLLYRHIEFEGPRGLIKFLTIVAKKRHPELEPWLDLSLVHSITYVDVEKRPFNSLADERVKGISLVPHRLHLPSSSTPGRLSLHSFNVFLPEDHSTTRIHPYFNPVELQLNGVVGDWISSLSVSVFSWTCLRRVVLVDSFLGDNLCESRLMQPSLAGLQVIYDISGSSWDRSVNWLRDDLIVEDGETGSIERISILVSTRKESEALLKSLVGSLLLPRITVLVKSSNETPSTDTST